jgi:hypothetical protein
MPILVKTKFNFGQIVYVKTDPDQYPRQITGIQGTPGDQPLIRLSQDGEHTWYYECEISLSRNFEPFDALDEEDPDDN